MWLVQCFVASGSPARCGRAEATSTSGRQRNTTRPKSNTSARPAFSDSFICGWALSRSGAACGRRVDEAAQQPRRGAVEALRVAAVEARQQRVAQRLAELDAPLVEAVDAPQRARAEDAVLVERHQRAER